MILVVGLSGSGKSSQCQMLEETGRYKWLSVGQLLRTSIKDQAQKAIIDSGEILDDNIVLPLVLECLESHDSNQTIELILDGFPRTLNQAKWLIEKKNQNQISITGIIHLNASPETNLQRLLSRGRTDDHQEAIQKRFAAYESMILPILDYLRGAGVRVIKIDGEGTKETVHQQILAELEK